MKKKTLLQSSGFVTLFASLVCIAIGLLFGFLVLLLLGGDKAYSDGFKQILLGGFYMMPSGIGKEIVPEGLKVLDTAYAVEDYAAAFAKGSELTEPFNQALEALIADGTVKTIVDKYISAN